MVFALKESMREDVSGMRDGGGEEERGGGMARAYIVVIRDRLERRVQSYIADT